MNKKIIILIILALVLRFWALQQPVPTYAKYYTRIASEQLEKNELPQSIKNLNRALFHNPNYRPAHFLLGTANLASKSPQAQDNFLEVIALGPDYQKIYADLQSSDAIRDEDYSQACLEAGVFYVSKSELALGIQYLERAVLFGRYIERNHYNLGLAYLQNHEWLKAIEQSNILDDRQIYPPSQRIREQIPNLLDYEHLLR